MNCWVVRSPYQHRGWDDVLSKGIFRLYGIRNAESCSNVRKMKAGDKVLYYHGPSGRALFGVMTVSKAAYPDPTSSNVRWLAIDCDPESTFPNPVKLSNLRKLPELADCPLLARPRLSVARLSSQEFKIILNHN